MTELQLPDAITFVFTSSTVHIPLQLLVLQLEVLLAQRTLGSRWHDLGVAKKSSIHDLPSQLIN